MFFFISIFHVLMAFLSFLIFKKTSFYFSFKDFFLKDGLEPNLIDFLFIFLLFIISYISWFIFFLLFVTFIFKSLRQN
jgi:hypothetical protein